MDTATHASRLRRPRRRAGDRGDLALATGADDVPSKGFVVAALAGAFLTAMPAAPVAAVAVGIRTSRHAGTPGATAALVAVALVHAACGSFMPGVQYMYSEFANQDVPQTDLLAAYAGGALCLVALWLMEDWIVRTVQEARRQRASMQ